MRLRVSRRGLFEALPLLLLLAGLILFEQRGFAEAQKSPVSLANLHKILAILSALTVGLWRLLKFGAGQKIPFFVSIQIAIITIAMVSTLLAEYYTFVVYWKLLELASIALVSILMVRSTMRGAVAPDFYFKIIIGFMKFLMLTVVLSLVFFPAASLQPPVGEETLRSIDPLIVPYQVRGAIVILNPNSIGAIAGVLLLFSLGRLILGSARAPDVFWFLLSSILLVFSQSRTAIVGTIIAFFVMQIFNRRSSLGKRLGTILFGIVSAGLLSNAIWSLLSRGMDVNRLLNLSGRMFWWNAALEKYLESGTLMKIFGMGFYSAGRRILADIGFDGASSLHSDYFDVLVSTGAVGLALFLLFLLFSFRLLMRYRRVATSDNIPIIIGIFSVMFVRTFTGQTMMAYGIFYLLTLVILVTANAESIHSRRENNARS